MYNLDNFITLVDGEKAVARSEIQTTTFFALIRRNDELALRYLQEIIGPRGTSRSHS